MPNHRTPITTKNSLLVELLQHCDETGEKMHALADRSGLADSTISDMRRGTRKYVSLASVETLGATVGLELVWRPVGERQQ